jgi:AmmeMemoRadiSam system protein A
MHLHETPDWPGTELLRIARRSIEYGLDHGRPLPVQADTLPPALAEPAATFTTLTLDGKLRGCCGMLEAAKPLGEDVAYTAFQAAFRDTRFEPVRRDELDRIRLEVSVLSPLERMIVKDETDLLQQLVPGEDGLVIVEGASRATFLPKVWESLPDPRRFLAALRAKCGLPDNYWSERLRFFRYRTTSYAEPH